MVTIQFHAYSGLDRLSNIWNRSLAFLSVVDESKNTVILFSAVAQLNSRFTKETSCSDPQNTSCFSASLRRWFN